MHLGSLIAAALSPTLARRGKDVPLQARVEAKGKPRHLAVLVVTGVFSLMTGCGGGGPLWSGTKQLGVSNAMTFGRSVATDAIGNVYVAGETGGGLDGNTRTGSSDFFLTKYDSGGAKLYTKQLGVSEADTTAYSVTTDASGNVYVVGGTTGGLDGNKRSGLSDFFLTKYNSSGVKLYTRQLGVAGATTMGYSVAIDASGNVYVAGGTTGGLDGNTRTGGWDFFLTKYDSSGAKQYTKQLGVSDNMTYANSVAIDASGNVYVAGATTGGLDGNTPTGRQDLFLTKYDSSGAKKYTKQLGVSEANTFATSAATDASGNVYVAGGTGGGLDGNTLAGWDDLFLTKYNSSGAKQYTKQLGVSEATTFAYSVAIDASGNVYVAGETSGGLDSNTRKGSRDFFLTKYNSNGAKQYTKQLGVSEAISYANSVAIDASGSVFVAGDTDGGLDGNTRTGDWDFFLTKYSSSGVKQ